MTVVGKAKSVGHRVIMEWYYNNFNYFIIYQAGLPASRSSLKVMAKRKFLSFPLIRDR